MALPNSLCRFYLPLAVLFLPACRPAPEPASLPPRDVPARGLSIPAKPPVILPAGEPFITAAVPPAPVPAPFREFSLPAALPSTTLSPTPPQVPGRDSCPLPAVVPAKGKTVKAVLPKVIAAENALRKSVNPGNFSFYREPEGLLHNHISCLLQARDGALWMGTGGGACRFDGQYFSHYTAREGLVGDFVWCTAEDRHGNIWFGTNTGVSKFDGRSFTSFTQDDGLCGNRVFSILEDGEGAIWMGTDAGVSRFDGTRFTNYTAGEPARNVRSMILDRSGNVWFASPDGVCRYDGSSFTRLGTQQGLSSNDVLSLFEDRAGHIWFGTNGSGVCRYDGRSVTQYPMAGEAGGKPVYSISEDGQGAMLFGTIGGLGILEEGRLRWLSEAEGLSGNCIWSILNDRSGNCWLATNNGLDRYDGNAFLNFSEEDSPSDEAVYSILEDNAGDLWFSTYASGIRRYDGHSFARYTISNGLRSNHAWTSLKDRRGRSWFGTFGGGVTLYDGSSFRTFTTAQGLIDNYVLCMLEDGDGNLWFGTRGGVSKYNGRTFENFTVAQGLSRNFVWSMAKDRAGQLWFGTSGGGVNRYDGKTFTHFTAKDGLSDNVWSICTDRSGNTWFGTFDNGAVLYDGKTFTAFTESQGMPDDFVRTIFEDREGNLWFGTAKGLARLPAGQLPLNGRKPLFMQYTHADGFPGKECMRNAVFEDSRGRIWWGAGALVCYNPAGDRTDTAAPVVQLTGIDLFGEKISWASLEEHDTTLAGGTSLEDVRFDSLSPWYALPAALSLPYDNNSLVFHFTAVHLQSRNHLRYQYMLEGLDRRWSAVTGRSEAPYGNLPPGKYTFRVRAMNQSGHWSSAPGFAFEVRPPWWQTWWFRSFAFLAIAGGAVGFFRYRTASLRRRQKELERTVTERTAEVVEQKRLVEEKQQEIISSIHYAERIQRALLAGDKLLQENLPEHWVFFRPKDIVAGDFYWGISTGEGFLFITADCTGHGVPGAFMSLLNISKLSETINEKKITRPDLVLNEVRSEIIRALNPDGSDAESKDGMDCVLCRFRPGDRVLEYAAANNSFCIVRGHELLICKADKMPVGKLHDTPAPFTLHTVRLQPGDMIYTFTDGFADQFGGPKGKKFKYKQLEELLLRIAQDPAEEQKKKLEAAFESWKGELEQVDDVLVIGIRVP